MIPIGEYLPDQPAFQSTGALEMLNVIPGARSARPLPAFAPNTSALEARCQGAFTCRDLSGTVHGFCGTADSLFKLDTDGVTWTDVSGNTYTTAVDGRWVFEQVNNQVFATNGVDVLQLFTLDSSTVFGDAPGSPPVCSVLAAVREFLFLGRIAAANNRVQWSGFLDTATFAVSQTTQSDYRDIPTGGFNMGLVGGTSCLALMRNSIHRFSYIGPRPIFERDEIAADIGCMAEGSIAAFNEHCFFLSDAGLYDCIGHSQVIPIGEEKINKFLLADLDHTYPYRVTAAIIPQARSYLLSYPGAGNIAGTPNKGLIYHWPTGRFARFEQQVEMIYSAMVAGTVTLDTLPDDNMDDPTLPSLDSLIYSGAGRRGAAGFSVGHAQGFFNGPNMAATVDTSEQEIYPGKVALVHQARPMVQGTNCTVTVTPITRNTQTIDPTIGAAVATNAYGFCPLRKTARYHRARINVAAGGEWDHIFGLDDVKSDPRGWR